MSVLFGMHYGAIPHVLVVVDSKGNRDYVCSELQKVRAPIEISTADSVEAARHLLLRTRFDLIVVAADSFQKRQLIEWAAQGKRKLRQRLIPIILVTSTRDTTTRVRLFEAGVETILVKPVPVEEFRSVVTMQLHRKFMSDELEHVEHLLLGLVHTIEARDEYTAGHTYRVTHLSMMLAEAMHLPPHERGIVYAGALMHDIGKLGIPDAILKKPGPLTDREMDVVQQHPVIGVRVLGPLHSLQPVLGVVRHHHERWDGRGYPDGLQGTAIPLGARIVAVADCVDAMLSDRPYRRGLSPAAVRAILQEHAGTQWEADIVRVALDSNFVSTASLLARETSVAELAALQQQHRNAIYDDLVG